MAGIQDFWQWFVANDRGLVSLAERDWDDMLQKIGGSLQAVRPGLWVETRGKQGLLPVQLIFTADGNAELFPIVMDLLREPPSLSSWRFIALRPGRGFDFVLTLGGNRMDPKRLWYKPLFSSQRPEALGLRIGLPRDLSGNKGRVLTAVQLLLSMGLGEEIAAQEIDHIEVGDLPQQPVLEGFSQITSLAELLTKRREEKARLGYTRGGQGVG